MIKATRRRTEITIETREIKTIRMRDGAAFCLRCKVPTLTFNLEEIARMLQISVSDVCRNIDSDQFHLIGTERGTALICGNSLE